VIRAQEHGPRLEPPTCTDALLWDTWLSVYRLPVLTVADELGVFRLLESRPLSSNEIAEELALGLRAANAFLGMLVSLGFLAHYHERFTLTEASRNFLLPHGPFYWGGVLHGFKENFPTPQGIKEALLKDREHVAPTIGEDAPNTEDWEKGQVDPVRAEQFTRLMHSHSFPAATGVARQPVFKNVQRILDVAGGSGCFCIALASQHGQMQCTILELAPVCKLADAYVKDYGLEDRITTHAADMFRNPWPAGHDAVFFANIFHDWTREQCLDLAKKAFNVLPIGGHIFLHEMLLDDTKDGPLVASTFSMVMLLATKGKQFTAQELDELLQEAGFQGVTVTPTYAYYSLVSARKP